ncbi:SHOCT domain-containing protein [Flavobacterium flavigenum]|uniref:SHOCT domain-containing protein n=1 Tax=Flavobacterium flavigenum TaxID=3003258 RepID=UPI0022AC6894|nr:SHOCT domain-containing protein [Flavobacterium flavigenum]
MGFLDSLKDSLKFPRFSEKYEMGFPDISSGEKPVIIQFRENEVEFKILTGFTSVKKIIKPDDIIEVGLNQESYRSAGKAVTGAVIGGILTGGIGLLAGAAIGGKRRKENQLTLIVNNNGNECDIFLKQSKDIPKIYSELKRLLSKQTAKPISKESENSNNETKSNLAEDLEKLHNLLEKGILTQEEFNEQKRKMLE